ncbi:MAG: zinc ABC transporter substrate-binding protein [Clostridia bacterium]|nr:zinc ABC transporter substrate-binding protein [Clostridia bacterium]
MKKKLLTILLALFCLFSGMGAFSACNFTKNDDKISIVATIYPEYDWVMNVLGEEKESAKVTLLMNNGADLHNFQPTPQDIAAVSACDLFIYVGGESDEWVEDALENAVNADMVVINLLDVLGDKAKEEELVEGMEGEEEDEEEEEEDDTHAHDEEEIEYDEHVWLSLKNAKLFVDEIAKQLGKIDSDRAATYRANATAYNAKLSELDEKYQTAVAAASKNTILFGDRFPFRYLVDDYNLNYYAAFVGCSAETEAKFETIVFLAGKVNDLSLDVILKIESSDGKIAQTIKENTTAKNQKILTMDSLQSTTLKNAKSYLTVMEENLEILKQALA